MLPLRQKIVNALSEYSWMTLRDVADAANCSNMEETRNELNLLVSDGLIDKTHRYLTERECKEKGLVIETGPHLRWVYCKRG